MKMKLSWAQIGFFYLFDVLLLLLLLFGESFLSIYVIGAFCLLFLIFSPFVQFERARFFKQEITLGLVFMFSLMVSGFFTHNLPLSLEAGMRYSLVFVAFIFFILAQDKLLQLEFFLTNLVLVALGLGAMSLGFLLFPQIADQLPGMNLLYPTFGHNHYGLIVVLFLPVAWGLMAKYATQKDRFWLYFLAVLFLIFQLLLSFGRVLILLGFAEIALLIYWQRVQIKRWKSWVKVFLIGSLVLMGVAMLVKNGFTLMRLINPAFVCPISTYHELLCKNVKNDLRPIYWLTGLRAWSNNWFVGYGPGTYKLISERYKLHPDSGTSYAHNQVIQILAEGGLLMGIPVALMGIFFAGQIKSILKRRPEFGFLAIGLGATMLDSFFDYDLNFLAVMLMVIVLLALLLRQQAEPVAIPKARVGIPQLIYFGLQIFLLALVLISLRVEWLVGHNKVNQAVQFFPYFQTQIQLFMEDKNLSGSNRSRLEKLHRQVPVFHLRRDGNYLYQQAWNNLDTVAPWHFYEASLDYKNVASNSAETLSELRRTRDLYQQGRAFGFVGTMQSNDNLADLSIKLADEALQRRDFALAAELYQTAQQFKEWIMNEAFPRFVYGLTNEEDQRLFLRAMENYPHHYYGKHAEIMATAILEQYRAAVRSREIWAIEYWLMRVEAVRPWLNSSLNEQDLANLQLLVNRAVNSSAGETAEALIIMESKFNTYYATLQPGNYYLMRGDFDQAKRSYELCNQKWLEQWGTSHQDCLLNVELTQEKIANDQPFWLTSQAIMNF